MTYERNSYLPRHTNKFSDVEQDILIHLMSILSDGEDSNVCHVLDRLQSRMLSDHYLDAEEVGDLIDKLYNKLINNWSDE